MYAFSGIGGWSLGFQLVWAIHILAIVAFFAGVVFLLLLAGKTFTHAQLKRWAIWLITGGALVCLLTIGMVGHPWGAGGTGFGYGRGMMGAGWGGSMMWGTNQGRDASADASQGSEEAEGKGLYDKLQAGQLRCAQLSANDLELIGEYVMGQGLGANHTQMNQMMQRMMGAQGEQQMHVLMGERATGCGAGAASSQEQSS